METHVKEISVTMKRVTSIALWFSYFSFGIANNLLSPLLVEMKNKYETTIDEISNVFIVVLLAYLSGALTCGILFNYFNRQLMVVGLSCIMATGVFSIPHVPTETLFFVIAGVIGFTAGGFDTSQTVWMLEMWRGEAGVYIQAQFFFYALGSTVAPLLLKPFLLEESKDKNITLETSFPDSFPTTMPSSVSNSTGESQLYIPLSISGSIITLGASSILFLFCFDKYVPPTQGQSEETEVNQEYISRDDTGSIAKLFTKMRNLEWDKIALAGQLALIVGFYQGMENCTFQFMPTFTHYTDLAFPEPDGAAVLSGMTGAYTAGRLAGILITYYNVSPALILIFNLVLATTGNIILLIFANSNVTLLWTGAVLLGLGYSTVFACIFDYIEKHLKITNLIGASNAVVGGLVSAVYPLIVGDSVERKPLVLMYVIFFGLSMCTIMFSSIYYMTVIRKRVSNPQVGF
ncbi:unnamed protein product [Allacma fusca]|uniref:Uncharacterized protein n=1 Tax=Allacma fusca TaxID=39272 RepID=A0A8J2JF13_9HEXA|nr:unnamed protein product [Allacma fusca]